MNTRRRALVTGASSGIGAATARILASEGYRVALLARRAERLRELCAELDGGEDAHLIVPCDLLDPNALRASVGLVETEFGGLDLLVNSAGMGYRASVEELEDDTLHRVVDTNVNALVRVCRDCLPLLRRGERAVVVNLSSVVGAGAGFPVKPSTRPPRRPSPRSARRCVSSGRRRASPCAPWLRA